MLSWQYTIKEINKRIAILILFLIVGFLITTGRLFTLAFFYENQRGVNNFIDKDVTRREITDKNGELLATNLPMASIFAHPKKISNPEEVARQLSQSLPDLNYGQVLDKLKENKNFVWIKRGASPREQNIVQSLGINGVDATKDSKRFYAYSSMLAHVLGYVDQDGKGVAGIEKGLEKLITDKTLQDKKIALSIDMQIQSVVSEEVKAATREFSAIGGSAIVADVNTGEILAFVNEPSFNPHKIDLEDTNALENKNALCTYELGSIFKPIIMAIGLDTGIVDLCDVYDITELKVGKTPILDYNTKISGWCTVAQIFAKSSNKGLSQIALEVGQDKLKQYFKDLGLCERVPNIEIPERARPIHASYKENWSNLTLCTTSFGYSMALTPLHYVQAMIPIINGGNLLPLTFIKREKPPQGKRVFQNDSTSEKMRILLRLTVRHGSCKKIHVQGQDVGGKTGTSNKLINGRYCKERVFCSIIAAFPMNNPKYLVYMNLNEPKSPYGHLNSFASFTTAPFVGKIIDKISTMYGLLPDKKDYSEWDYLMTPPETYTTQSEEKSIKQSLTLGKEESLQIIEQKNSR